MKFLGPLRLRFAFLASLALCATVLTASATDGIYYQFQLDLGYAGGPMGPNNPEGRNWAIYTYGAGNSGNPFKALDVSAGSLIPDQVLGDVALAGIYSLLNVGGYGSITGDRYEQTTSTETINDHATLIGMRKSSPTINNSLNSGINSLINVAKMAALLPVTPGSPTSINTDKSMRFDNTAFAGKYVMNLKDFVLNNNSTITLNGVSGSSFVINVANNFSLSNNSSVVLTGGLTPSDVLFNVADKSGTISFDGKSKFSGTLLAYNPSKDGGQRQVSIGGESSIDGSVIASSVKVSGMGTVHKRPKGSN